MADPLAYINRAELETRFEAREIAELLGETYPPVLAAPTVVDSFKTTGASPQAGSLPVSEGDVLIAFVKIADYAVAHGIEIEDTQSNEWSQLGVAYSAIGAPAIVAFITTATETGYNEVSVSRPSGVLHLVVVQINGTNEENDFTIQRASVSGAPSVPLGTLADNHLVVAAALNSGVVTLAPGAGFSAVDSYHTDGILSVIQQSDPTPGPVSATWTGASPWIALGVDLPAAIESGWPDSSAKLRRAIHDATALVDGYLATQYDLPLSFTPTLVKGWAANVARFLLWKDRAPEEVRARYDDTISQMKDLAVGKVKLPPDSITEEDAPSYTQKFTSVANDRIFTPETLAGY